MMQRYNFVLILKLKFGNYTVQTKTSIRRLSRLFIAIEAILGWYSSEALQRQGTVISSITAPGLGQCAN